MPNPKRAPTDARIDEIRTAFGVDLESACERAAFNAIIANPLLVDDVLDAHDDGWFTTAFAPSTQDTHKDRQKRAKRFCEQMQIPYDPMAEDGVLALCAWLATDPRDIAAEDRIPLDDERTKATSPATLSLYVDAIEALHRHRGHSRIKTPFVRDWLSGYRRIWTAAGNHTRRAVPITPTGLRTLIGEINNGAIDWKTASKDRNELRRAFLGLYVTWGFVGFMRPSEIASIEVPWVSATATGLLVRHPRTKYRLDGRDVALPALEDTILCPVAAFSRWATACSRVGGLPDVYLFAKPMSAAREPFKSPAVAANPPAAITAINDHVGKLLKKAANSAGILIDTEQWYLSPQALRRSGATAAHQEGTASLAQLRRALGHQNPDNTRLYVEIHTP